MRARALTVAFVVGLTTGLVTTFGPPAGADHLLPPGPHSSNTETTEAGLALGAGTWAHISNFPANPGTDLKFFRDNREIFASSGTLGTGDEGHVGQRITKLTTGQGSVVNPTWWADHASANCVAPSTGVTGLQHDAAVAGAFRRTSRPTSIPGAESLDIQLLIDTTDSTTGRCHDTAGGGLEIIDITNPANPRELHLTRHRGTTHTATVDATRPYIVYSDSSDFSGNNTIDVVDVRSCLNLGSATLADKRAACRPLVYRLKMVDEWTYQRNFYNGGGAIDPTFGSAACHDITAIGTRLYCAGIRATLILDVANLTDPATGNVRGTPLACPLIAGTNTAAMVSNCAGTGGPANTIDAGAFEFLGTVNHAGIDCTMPPAPRNTNCNSNLLVASTEDVSISHEAEPTPDGNVMFVTDERGGGVVPPGASCVTGGDNPIGNGGIHAYDISGATPGRPAVPNFPHMLQPNGAKATFIGNAIAPAPTFCDVHVIQHVPGEQRLVAAYYSQGVKIVDYWIHDQGNSDPSDDRLSFRETSCFLLPGANTWTAEHFKVVSNGDGTRTYFIMASDIQRGIDVYTFRHTPNPIGSAAPGTITNCLPTVAAGGIGTANLAAGGATAWLLLFALAALPPVVLFAPRRRRSRS